MQRQRMRLSWISAWLSTALLFSAMLSTPALFAQDANTTGLRHAADFLAAGNLERAETELQSVLRTSPDEYRALDLLGVIRVMQRREADAEDLFGRVVELKPDFA